VIKARHRRCAGNLKHAGRGEMHTEFLVEKIEGKRALGRSGSRWERSIKMDHEEIKCEAFDCIKLAHDIDSDGL
jgi:hypothetical protein